MGRNRAAAAPTAPRRISAHSELTIHAPLRSVWDLLVSPESEGDLEPNVTAYLAPGTGPGLGEIHIHLTRRPGELVSKFRAFQVTEFDPYVRLSIVRLGPRSTVRLGFDFTLADLDGSVRLTAAAWSEVVAVAEDPRVDQVLSVLQVDLTTAVGELLRRVRDHVEGSGR